MSKTAAGIGGALRKVFGMGKAEAEAELEMPYAEATARVYEPELRDHEIFKTPTTPSPPQQQAYQGQPPLTSQSSDQYSPEMLEYAKST